MINLFPYTDAHELNLDWVIKQVKANNTKVKDITHTIENMHFDFDSKADKATTYTKTEVNTLLAAKADTSNLATVATSGNYNDLTNKPTIPAAQVNSDWNAISGVAQILNKPTIPAAQVNSDWNANSGVAEILNKPTTLNGYGITDAYTQNEVDTIASGLQGQITGIKTAISGNFTAGTNITIGSRNFWRKQNGFVSMTVVLTVTANITGGAALLTDNDLTFVNNSYLYARKEDGTIEILTCNGHNIITEFGISSGTVLRIGATIFVQ